MKYENPLREWLIANHITMYRLSKAAGVFSQAIQDIAHDKRLPSVITALKIEDATGGDVKVRDWLKTEQGHIEYTYGRAERTRANQRAAKAAARKSKDEGTPE